MMSDTMKEMSRRKPRKNFVPEIELEAENPFEEIESTVPRMEMRDEMREESSLERAKRRTASLRGQLDNIGDGQDKFYVDPSIIPEGWAYEWKRRLLMGAEDPSHMVELARNGWEPVPLRRCPGHMAMMPSGWAGNTIERDGMVLMERPAEVVQEARQIHDYLARKQVRDKEAQIAGTPDGTLTRDHAKVRPSIKKGYEAMPIPKE
jgi:hypothetical protein